MDIAPPSAPPAEIRRTNQESVDAAGRLVAVQDWLMDQQARLPDFPDTTLDAGREEYLGKLARFWESPTAPEPGSVSIFRSRAFADRLADLMSDEATLRSLDGTLSERAKALVTRFSRLKGHPMTSTMHAHELLFGTVAYAGAVILTEDASADMLLVFHPDRGWDEFPDRGAFYRDEEARVRKMVARNDALPGILATDLEAVLASSFVGSREIEGDAFAAITSRIVDLLQQRAEADMASSLTPKLRIHDVVDVHSLVAMRELRLSKALNRERLQNVPAHVRDGWHDAAVDFSTAARMAAIAHDVQGLTTPEPLDTFTRRLLVRALQSRGITTDPMQIRVGIYAIPDIGTPWETVGAAINGVETYATTRLETISLESLAQRNTGFLDRRIFRLEDADGQAITTPGHAGIRSMVREMNLASAYRAHVHDTLVAAGIGEGNRRVAGPVQKARMRFEAADARVWYHRPDDEPRSFADHHGERGYAWVSAILDSPAPQGRRQVDGHDIVVHRLRYSHADIEGMLVIGVRSQGSVARVVYYTPDAPDGVAFREFSGRSVAIRHFLSDDGMREYLLRRLPASVVEVRPGGERRFRQDATDRNANFALSGKDTFGATMALFDEVPVQQDFLDASYDQAVTRLLENLDNVTRSTGRADIDDLSPAMDPETIARHIGTLLGRPAQAAWQSYDHIKAGDHAKAFIAFANAYTSALELLPLPAVRAWGSRPLLARRSAGALTLDSTRKRLRHPGQLNEPRFIAHGVRIDRAGPPNHGVYTVNGRRYIEDGGKVYGVERAGQEWKIVRHDQPGTTLYGAHVARDAQGRWQYTGIMGGMNRAVVPELGPVPFNRLVAQVDDAMGSTSLSPWQREVMTRALSRMVPFDEAMAITRLVRRRRLLRANDLQVDVSLTPVQETLWNRARTEGEFATRARQTRMWDMQTGERVDSGPSRRAKGRSIAPSIDDLGALPPGPWSSRPIGSVARHDPASRLTTRVLPPEQWPEFVWHYASENGSSTPSGGSSLLIPQSRLARVNQNGIHVLRMGPQLPEADLVARLAHPLVPNGVTGLPEAVRINLGALRHQLDHRGNPVYTLSEINDHLGYGYVLSASNGQFIPLGAGEFAL